MPFTEDVWESLPLRHGESGPAERASRARTWAKMQDQSPRGAPEWSPSEPFPRDVHRETSVSPAQAGSWGGGVRQEKAQRVRSARSGVQQTYLARFRGTRCKRGGLSARKFAAANMQALQ